MISKGSESERLKVPPHWPCGWGRSHQPRSQHMGSWGLAKAGNSVPPEPRQGAGHHGHLDSSPGDPLQTPELCDSKRTDFCCFKPASLYYFVIAAIGN